MLLVQCGHMNTNHTLSSELKFIISGNTGVDVREWARAELEADPNAAESDAYVTASIYFDTDEFDTFFGRMSYARAKYRIRRYNDSPVVFLERKLKVAGRVAKRRSNVALADLWRVQSGGAREEQWFWRRVQYRRLEPICRIAYNRTARVGVSPAGPLRPTIYEQIIAPPV